MLRIKKNIDKYYYRRNWLLSLALSLLLIILVTIYFPRIDQKKIQIKMTDENIVLEFVPYTVQENPSKAFGRKRPETPEIILSDITEEIEPEEISIVNLSHGKSISEDEQGKADKSELAGSITFAPPRQLLEVLPQKVSSNAEGNITLSLKINNSGNVTDHKILANTINSEDCLQKVLEAAYSTRWEKLHLESNEFWVTKSYKFE